MAGKAAHASLASYFTSGGNRIGAMNELKAQYEEWAMNNVPPDDRLSWENIYTIMDEYYIDHPIQRFPFLPVEESAERGTIVKLIEGIDYFALLDLAGYEKAVGGQYVIDHKTTGRITEWWAKQFRIGSQLTGYMWSMQVATGNPVVGAYVNAIEFGKLPAPVEKKCRTHKVNYSECWRKHAKWELFIANRTPEMIEKWKVDAIQLAKRFEGLKKIFGGRLELLPFVPQQGVFNGSCTFCQFRDFCAAERRPELVESMLIYAPWRPWDEQA